ncbi:MAG: DUF1134 domain-containing protein [Hellea sp.]|nr:DUF1134 domain-containing protein [Hellea sp.]
MIQLKTALLTLIAGLAMTACATNDTNPATHAEMQSRHDQAVLAGGNGYSENELVGAVSTHLGVTAESAATTIEKLFKNRGRPTGYITGEEAGGALVVGLRYGKGTLWMKNGETRKVYWQGPTVGFDAGADASKVFTLVYGLENPDFIYRRFPGVDGSAFLVAGMAVNYQKAEGVTLAPIRTGVGLRLGAKVGYTSYKKKRNIIPF